nr:ApiAP2 hypothetical protein [Eimeria necatrix]
MAGLDAAFEQDHTWPSTSLTFTGVHEQDGEIGSVLRPAKRNRKHITSRTLGSPQTPLMHKKPKDMETMEAREAPGKFVAVLGLQGAERVQRASAFHKSGFTAARVGPSNGQRAVAGRLYFHANKMAWRSELMVDGSKRQRSFSCKLYGYERARLLCEWSRNFVSQTARLPTDDETREAVRILMRLKIHTKHKAMDVSDLMSRPQGLSVVGTGPQFQSRAENKHAPTSAQGKAADYRTRQCDSARNFTTEHLAGTCNNKESGTYWGLETLDQDNTSLPHFMHECICADAKGKCGHCREPDSKPLHQEIYVKSKSSQTAGGSAEAAVATHQSEGECPERQSVSIAASAFRELGSLTALKTTVKRTKRQKAGKKPQSGVRGLYIHQNAWKVNYIERHGLATKLFAYPLGDIEEMKRQHLLARFFLRSVIEKKRQIYESDGEGLSEDEAVWTRRVERVGKFPQIPPLRQSSQMTQKGTHCALGRGEQSHRFTLKLLPSFNEPGNTGFEDSFDTEELHKYNHWGTLKLLLQRGNSPVLSPLARENNLSLKITPPNSSLVFSGDDPDDGEMMMHSMMMSSEACPSSLEAPDEMPTILNKTKDSSGEGGGMVCKSK